jgi:hypothetical protein
MPHLSKIQTVLIPESWALKDAKGWLAAHKYKHSKVDITENFYRFRQRPPGGGKYFTVGLPNGIELVFENDDESESETEKESGSETESSGKSSSESESETEGKPSVFRVKGKGGMRYVKKTVGPSKAELIKEHIGLVKVLSADKPAQIKSELAKQSSELKQLKGSSGQIQHRNLFGEWIRAKSGKSFSEWKASR